MPPSPSLLLDQFKNIWGQEAFSGGRVVGRGKFSLLYGSKDTSEEDVERWVQTCWLLEVTEKLVGQQKGKEENWLLQGGGHGGEEGVLQAVLVAAVPCP